MKRNKSGISLIVLVITIIVMIILAGSIILSLSNSGIIGKAQDAVDANNLKQVQQLASLAWSEAYLDKLEDSSVDLEARVLQALEDNDVNIDKYAITVTDSGVKVKQKGGSTLGSLITDPTVDYGKLVDYEANGVTEWQVFYEDEVNGYVFLISKDIVKTPNGGLKTVEVTDEINSVYNLFKLGQEGYTLVNEQMTSKYVAFLISNYTDYADTTASYKEYVVGSIGAPTIELFAASYNAKHNTTALTYYVDLTKYSYNVDEWGSASGYDGASGYFESFSRWAFDGLCVLQDAYWLAAPSAYVAHDSGETGVYQIWNDGYFNGYPGYYGSEIAIRPVVCLKADIPAVATETGYSLVK